MIGAMEDLMNQGYTEDEATELYFRQVYGNPPDSMSPPVRRATPVPTVVPERQASPAPRQASPAPRQAAGTIYAPNGQAVAYAGIGNGYNVAPVIGGYSPYPTMIMLPPVQSGYSLLADIVQRVPTYNYGSYFDSIVRQGVRTPRRRATTPTKPAPPTNPTTPAAPAVQPSAQSTFTPDAGFAGVGGGGGGGGGVGDDYTARFSTADDYGMILQPVPRAASEARGQQWRPIRRNGRIINYVPLYESNPLVRPAFPPQNLYQNEERYSSKPYGIWP